MGAKAEITASVPAVVPLWGPNRFWPGYGLVLRCLGPGFTVLALGLYSFIHSNVGLKTVECSDVSYT